jgi:predicted CDP-diglyceride synthetase/phosphatidate cytidylyltransferase
MQQLSAQGKFWWVMGGVLALLLLASAIGWWLHRRAAPDKREVIDNLNMRIRAWWAMVAVLCGCFLLGRVTTLVFFALASFFALREFTTLTPTRRGDHLPLVVQISDVLQYVFGKLFGKHKLAPKVSPSKTVEGLVGGGLAATAIGTALWWITPFSPLGAAGMSLVIVVSGFLGGLALSAVKRSLGAKDWGTMIEGHGGILDRLDSVCFAAPIFFHVVRYAYA